MNRENEIIQVNLGEIIPNRFQPRLNFNETELNELAESIKTHGVIQPLVLRRLNDKFEIIAGERRYKASIIAGLQSVPAIIMNLDDKQSAEVALIENIQRKDLTAIEEAQSYKRILDMNYVTQEELAKKLGVSQSTIANKIRLLNLTQEAQNALLTNKISERHARSLLQLTDALMQIDMTNKIINQKLTVRQTDEEINKLLGKQNSIETELIPKQTDKIEILDNFDIDIDKIISNSQDIIENDKPSDIDMLLRKPILEPEAQKSIEPQTIIGNESINVITPTPTINNNVNLNTDLAINPFQDTTEIMEFEIPQKDADIPLTQNSIINEFKKEYSKSEKTSQSEPTQNIVTAISSIREEKNRLHDLGYDVDAEEFDFEDMYQIIIKIKK